MPRFVILFYLLVLLGGGTGWVRNIIAVIHSDFDNINGELVVRAIGIPFVPAGAVMGWVP